LQNLHKLGITSVHDMHIGTIRQLEAYRQLDQEKKLKANILGYVNPYLLDDPQLSPYLDYVGNRFSIAGVKLFLDGAIGLHTAKLSRNYCDKNTSGILRYTTEETLDIVYKAFCHGIRDFALHAIGDHAIDQCIEVAERFKHNHGDKDVRFRVEHAELLTTNAITKMKELNIVPVPQPNFHWDIENYQERLGDFDQLVNPFSNILEAGVLLVFGSDGMPDAPMVGLHYAMNHAKYDCQKISLEQGIEAYTLGGARLAHKEKSRGSISIGKQANFILLDNNPFEHTENLRNIPITQTWIDGEPLL
ncbi:amidohydrolase family protein, partial [Candidatus Nomurabacteria bacterium]|nr:amidohydrolase family protein [Candidatus Nomurabacteria bacterium]